jgi:hypothetical protein
LHIYVPLQKSHQSPLTLVLKFEIKAVISNFGGHHMKKIPIIGALVLLATAFPATATSIGGSVTGGTALTSGGVFVS